MKITLLLGDNTERMPELGSVGVVLSDPPYGLAFMGKEFDTLGDGESQQLWHHAWLMEAYNLLPSGGLILAFSGTRTFHRLAAAYEDAGFEVIGIKAWGYGCLTDDAEILTEHGWKPGVDVVKGELVACWDPDTGAIRLDTVEEVTRAPYSGKMVAFQNDNTDQLLTPNHRVYKKHRIRKVVAGKRVASEDGSWTVQPAGEINRWNNIRLPLAGAHDGPGVGGEDWARLLAWVWTEGGYDNSGSGVRLYQSSVNQPHVNEIQRLLDLFVPGHSRYRREREYKGRSYTETCWYFSGQMAEQIRAVMPVKRPTWELLWGMTQAEKHAFCDAAVDGDGSIGQGKRRKDGTLGPGRVAFYQKNPDDLIWFQTLAHLMNRQGRINFPKRVVGLHMNPATQLQGRHLRAKVSETYDGDVWCVRVPTGAFLARRNDKVFITGNSGFPKSLNISKALDKMVGAEREVVGFKPGVGGENMNDIVRGSEVRTTDDEGGKGLGAYGVGAKQVRVDVPVTVPSTEAAKAFDGYGTALKPAWEPVLVGRKP